MLPSSFVSRTLGRLKGWSVGWFWLQRNTGEGPSPTGGGVIRGLDCVFFVVSFPLLRIAWERTGARAGKWQFRPMRALLVKDFFYDRRKDGGDDTK